MQDGSFERLLDTRAAAKLIGVHEKTIQRMARKGLIPGFRIGDLWKFRASLLDEWLLSQLCSSPPLVSAA